MAGSESPSPDPWRRALYEARDYLEHHEATGDLESLRLAEALLMEANMLAPDPD